jgi:hypothetical protein
MIWSRTQRLIAESNEDNNATSVTADVSTQPDLSFTDATAKFDEVAREMVLSFCVINRGKASSNETRVSIRDPATGTEIQNPRIAPLASDQRTCRDGLLLPIPAGFSGTQRYELTVDPDGKVIESNEDNNTDRAEAYVSALPNLAFADLDQVRRGHPARHVDVLRGQPGPGFIERGRFIDPGFRQCRRQPQGGSALGIQPGVLQRRGDADPRRLCRHPFV